MLYVIGFLQVRSVEAGDFVGKGKNKGGPALQPPKNIYEATTRATCVWDWALPML